MKIVLVALEWSAKGGLEILTGQVAHALQEMGHDVKVFSVYDSEVNLICGIKSTPLAPRSRLFYRAGRRFNLLGINARLRVAATCPDIDLIILGHAQLMKAFAPLLSGDKRPRHSLLWAHGIDVWGQPGRILAPYLAGLDAVVSVSEFTARRLSEDAGFNRIVVIPNFVDTDFFTPVKNPALIRRNEVLICSRLALEGSNKGHEVLFRALPLAEAMCGSQLRIRVIGDGDGRPRLEALARDLQVANRVTFSGRVSYADLREAYQECGVFVLPSRVIERPTDYWSGEGFGLVYAEAAACGRPVLASTHGGAAETLIDGRTGFLIDPCSPAAVAGGIAKLVTNPIKADDMGRAGRLMVQERVSKPVFKRNLRQLIDNLCM